MSDDADKKAPKLRLSRDVHAESKAGDSPEASGPPASGAPASGSHHSEKPPAPPEPGAGSGPAKPRLSLSRDQSPDRDGPAPAGAGDAPGAADGEAPPPEEVKQAPRLKKPPAAGTFDPDDPFGDILPKTQKPTEDASATAEAALKKSLHPDRTKLELAAQKPVFAEKQAPPKDESPPELPSKPKPKKDDGSAQLLDQTLDALPKEPRKSHLPVASLIMIILLLLIIGGVGGGIWFVLKGDAPVEETGAALPDATPTTEAPTAAAPNPIERAREVIARIPDADIETIAEGGLTGLAEDAAPSPAATPPPSPSSTLTPPAGLSSGAPAPERPEPILPAAGSPASGGDRPLPSPATPSDALSKEVSAFLSSATIGGVRGGAQARLMLNGSSFTAGEEVHAPTGLRFVGIKEERLVFRDANGIYYLKSF